MQEEYHWWKKKKENLSVCTACALKRRSLDTGGYCDAAPNGSQCLNHLTVVVLSSRDHQLLILKAVCYKDVAQKKGIFFFRKKKETNQKDHYTFHIRTFTNTEADAERGGAHFTVCQIDLNTPSLLNRVSRKTRKKLNESTNSSSVN